MASLIVLMSAIRDNRRVGELCELLEVNPRTVQRWRAWWREEFVKTTAWGSLRGLLPEPVHPTDLPRGLLDYFGGPRPRPIRDLLREIALVAGDSSRDS